LLSLGSRIFFQACILIVSPERQPSLKKNTSNLSFSNKLSLASSYLLVGDEAIFCFQMFSNVFHSTPETFPYPKKIVFCVVIFSHSCSKSIFRMTEDDEAEDDFFRVWKFFGSGMENI